MLDGILRKLARYIALELDALAADRIQTRDTERPSFGDHEFPNAGSPWLVSEDKELRIRVVCDETVEQMAEAHGRTKGAILARLKRLHLIYYHDNGVYCFRHNDQKVIVNNMKYSAKRHRNNRY